MKVLIVSPSIFSQEMGAVRDHFHLFPLLSYVRRRNPDVEFEVLDLGREIGRPTTAAEVDHFLECAEYLLRRSGFDLVGISCWSTLHYLSTMAIARLCKRLNPEAPVVVGGYHATYLPQDFSMPNTPVDYVVLGEGEEVFHRIIRGQVPREARPQLVQGVPIDLEAEPLEWEGYKYFENLEAIGLFLSRGCPFACAFCLDRRTKRRGYSPSRSLLEVEAIQRAYPQVQYVMFYDPLWGADRRWRKEFLTLLRERKHDLSFWAETRVDLLDQEDVELMADLRDFHLAMGLESVSPRMLTIMQKTTNPARYLEQFAAVAGHLNRRRMVHSVFQMYNYPGETTETLDESLAYWQRYYEDQDEVYTFALGLSYQLYPGSEVFLHQQEFHEKYGTVLLGTDWWKKMPIMELSDVIPSRELAEAKQIGRYKDIVMRLRLWINERVPAHCHERIERLYYSGDRSIVDPRRPDYFDDKPLRLGDRTHWHERLDGRAVLYEFGRDTYFTCSRKTTEILRGLTRAGETVASLAQQHAAVYPNAEEYQAKLRRLAEDLLAGKMLQVGYDPPGDELLPVDREYFARLVTAGGSLLMRLFPAEAPLTTASFVQLARRGFYDGLLFNTVRQGAYIAAGKYLITGGGPGYTLEVEVSERKHAAGALSMAREGLATHGSQFLICHQAQPGMDGKQIVFGQVIEGLELLDRLLPGNSIHRLEILEAPLGSAAPPVTVSQALGGE